MQGKPTKVPIYDFKIHQALKDQWNVLEPKPIIIFEGILSMYDERIRNMFDLKIFVNIDLDLALARRIKRDISERGRDLREVLHRFHTFVKKDYNNYVKGQMNHANLIIPGDAQDDSFLKSCSGLGGRPSEQKSRNHER